MTFEEILDQAMAMLQRRGRVTYQTLQLQFQLDAERLEALKDALLYMSPQVHNDAGRGLIWMYTPRAVAAEVARRFDAVLAAVTALLRCEGRVTYRLLTLACGLDTVLLEAVCRELAFKQLAYDAHGEGLVGPATICRTPPRLTRCPAAGASRRCWPPCGTVPGMVSTRPGAYVPKLLAMRRIVADPTSHGLAFAPIANQAYFAQVEVAGQIDLNVAAELADLPKEELLALNPAFNHWVTTRTAHIACWFRWIVTPE